MTGRPATGRPVAGGAVTGGAAAVPQAVQVDRADDGDARVGQPPGGGEPADAAGVDRGQVVDAGHLGVAGQHRGGIQGAAVADLLQPLEGRAHPFPAAAVHGRDHHVRSACPPAPGLLEHRAGDAAAGRVAQVNPDGPARPPPRRAGRGVRRGRAVLAGPCGPVRPSVRCRWMSGSWLARRSARPGRQRSSRPAGGAARTRCRAPVSRTAWAISAAVSVPSRARTAAPAAWAMARTVAPPPGSPPPGFPVAGFPVAGFPGRASRWRASRWRASRWRAEGEYRAFRVAAAGQPGAALHQRLGLGRVGDRHQHVQRLPGPGPARRGERLGDDPQPDLAQRGQGLRLEQAAERLPRPARAGRCSRARAACAAPPGSCPGTGSRRPPRGPHRARWRPGTAR